MNSVSYLSRAADLGLMNEMSATSQVAQLPHQKMVKVILEKFTESSRPIKYQKFVYNEKFQIAVNYQIFMAILNVWISLQWFDLVRLSGAQSCVTVISSTVRLGCHLIL